MTIKNGDLPGFLPTQRMLGPGADIVAQYGCVHNNRILVSVSPSGGNTSIRTV